MYKNRFLYALLLPLSFIIHGCAPSASNVEMDAKFVTMGLDYDNLKNIMNAMVESLMQDPYVQNLKTSEPKILAISDIINDTTQKIDVELLARELARAMRKSGKFRLTMAISRSGGSTDNMIKDARALRDDKEYNQYTTTEAGSLSAPSLSLSGKISQSIHRINKRKKVDYFVILTLTDIKSGEVIWDDQREVSKMGDAQIW